MACPKKKKKNMQNPTNKWQQLIKLRIGSKISTITKKKKVHPINSYFDTNLVIVLIAIQYLSQCCIETLLLLFIHKTARLC